jgi:DNA-binding NtrC family response regulator
LRERSVDIPELLEYFARKLADELGVAAYRFNSEDIARLQAYPWPGNVRELRNVVERTLLFGRPPWDSIGAADGHAASAEPATNGFPADWTMEEVEKHHTLRVLGAARGNKSEAARRLGVSRKTLERKLVSWPKPEQPAG